MKSDNQFAKSAGISLLFAGALATIAGNKARRLDEVQPPVPNPSRIVQAGQLRDDQDQDNGAYIPGVGYYQSAYHTWFPYPFNWYYPGYGYYYGGYWNSNSYVGSVPPRSRPFRESLAQVHEFARTGSTSGFAHGGSFSSTFGESGHGISRGGFGSGFGGRS